MFSTGRFLRSLTMGRFAHTPTPSNHDNHVLERVRQQMLQMLVPVEGAGFGHVVERVRYATGLESLWYLRQDMLSALSTVHGEVSARQEVAPLNELFKGHLPRALTATPVRHHAPN